MRTPTIVATFEVVKYLLFGASGEGAAREYQGGDKNYQWAPRGRWKVFAFHLGHLLNRRVQHK
jgi:hypothetical protein